MRDIAIAIWARLRRSFHTIRFQFLGLLAGMMFTLVIVLVSVHSVLEVQKINKANLKEAKALAGFTARSLESQFEYLDPAELEYILASVKSRDHVKGVFAVNLDRTLFLDADIETTPMQDFPDISQFLASEQMLRQVVQMSSDFIAVSEPLKSENGLVGSMLIQYDNPSLLQIGVPIFFTTLFGALPVLAIGLLLSRLMVNRITRPLEQMSFAAAKISTGDMHTSIEHKGPREMIALSISMERMMRQMRQNISRMSELAFVDHITQLPNREYFSRELERSILETQRKENIGALLFMDLDGFKAVNDTHGHDVGDLLLAAFADRVRDVVRQADMIGRADTKKADVSGAGDLSIDGATCSPGDQLVARLGGDEFTVLLNDLNTPIDASLVCERILDVSSVPFEIEGHLITIGVSIGIAVFPADGCDSQLILKRADVAMYKAKKTGKQQYQYYSDEMQEFAEQLDDMSVQELVDLSVLGAETKAGLERLPKIEDLNELPVLKSPPTAPVAPHDDGLADNHNRRSDILKAS